MANVDADQVVMTGGPAVVYSFSIHQFEAGTPFTMEVEVYGEGGTDTTGYVLTKTSRR